MTDIIGAPTLAAALAALSKTVRRNESNGEETLVFCEDRVTLLAERAVLEGSGGTFLTEVTTFARFLKGGKTVSKQGSTMIVSSLIAENAEKLRCFSKGAAQAVYETIAQLSASRVTADMLSESAEQTEGVLRAKLFDLSLLLSEYKRFLGERGLLDENEYLALLPQAIERECRGKDVIFFAFPSFTRQAREGVRAALGCAHNVTGIFFAGHAGYYTLEAARIFREIAEEFGGARLAQYKSGKTGDAAVLEHTLFSPDRLPPAPSPAAEVYYAEPDDEEQELMLVCGLIRKKVAEGARYGQISVLVNADRFPAVRRAFGAYRIPCYSDERRAYSGHPFVRFLLAVLGGVSCGVLPVYADAIAASVYFGDGSEYRNYLMKYGAFRGAVYREIKEGQAVKDYDRDMLVSCRERMRAILQCFKPSQSGKAYCDGVRALMERVDAERVTQSLKDHLEREDADFLSLEPLLSALAEIELVAGERTFTAREFASLVESGAQAAEISVLQSRADVVFVGDATDSALCSPEILFVLGIDDSLPRVAKDTAVISDGEIGALSDLRVEIEPAISVVNARARESLALNLFSFEKELYLSRPKSAGGEETHAGEVTEYVFSALTPKPFPDPFPYSCCEIAPATRNLLAARADFERGKTDDPLRFSAIYAALSEVGKGREIDRLLEGDRRESVAGADKLFFATPVSPTLLEAYFECPYAGFLSRGLRLKEREERSVQDTDAGVFVHAVLERVAPDFETLGSEEACAAKTREIAQTLLNEPRFSSLADTREGVYTGERLVGESVAVACAAYRQLVGSSFRIRATENRVDIPALSLTGKADRIDEAAGYLRVIDYKTGTIDDKPLSYYTGRRLQLQLYLLGALGEGKPAGAFYFPAQDAFGAEGEEKFRMKGFFSNADEVLSLMDNARTEGKSAYFEGGGRTEKGMPQDDFSAFLEYSLLVAQGAEEEMKRGNIRPSPYEGACEYCRYKGVCGFVSHPRKESGISCKDIVRIVRKARGEEL